MQKVLFGREVLDCFGDQVNDVVDRSLEAVVGDNLDAAILAIEAGVGEKLSVETLGCWPMTVRVSRWISAQDACEPCEGECKCKCKCGYWQPAFDWVAVDDESEVADYNAETGDFCEGADGKIHLWIEQTFQRTGLDGPNDLDALLRMGGVACEEGLLSFQTPAWGEASICAVLGLAAKEDE